MKRIVPALLLVLAACAPRVEPTHSPRLVDSEDERAANQAALEQLEARGRQQQSPNQAAMNDGGPALPILPVSVVEPPPAPAELGEGQIRRRDMREFMEGGPHAILRAVEVEPEMDGEAFLGFRVSAVDQVALEDSGLRPGDVVTAVNGVDISQPDGFMRVWDSMERADHLHVDIIRRGRAQTLAWEIE